ncbi:hypothetical protein [Chryseobacterium caseinilyticum]|uniref:DUF4303 domain-containing protein n=1 Tax=Chryseobacterium caseinilyticum TaxID=2771428 RepID=A0ABR8ZE90_9FLAO|nr:hypothetical protein [Chryseobacterium caseinilyticum]MBD8083215.1 hypothetical protein [Chryseobacterium caseinilyticum]
MISHQIELEIDKAFIKTFLDPRRDALTEFLTKFLNSEFKFREDSMKIYVVSLFMYAPSPLSFLFIEPNYQYYSPDFTINRPEINFDGYSYIEIDELCTKVLGENNVDYSAHLDSSGELDSAIFWENRYKLEREFILSCWKNARSNSQSQIIAFLEYSDFAGGIYDLDNDYCISDDFPEVDIYLESKNIFFEKEI